MKKYKNIVQKVMLIAVVLFPFSALAQPKSYSFAELYNLQKTEKKNTLVFIHTDWCRYCQSMKNTTFKDKEIIRLINEQFWFADLNAEEKQDIIFNGYTFKYKPTGSSTGIHELAEQLATINGKVSYPALCILNAEHEIIFQYDQFLSSADLLKVLNEVSKKRSEF